MDFDIQRPILEELGTKTKPSSPVLKVVSDKNQADCSTPRPRRSNRKDADYYAVVDVCLAAWPDQFSSRVFLNRNIVVFWNGFKPLETQFLMFAMVNLHLGLGDSEPEPQRDLSGSWCFYIRFYWRDPILLRVWVTRQQYRRFEEDA